MTSLLVTMTHNYTSLLSYVLYHLPPLLSRLSFSFCPSPSFHPSLSLPTSLSLFLPSSLSLPLSLSLSLPLSPSLSLPPSPPSLPPFSLPPSSLSPLKGYIKGYISHQHQKLVVSKQLVFPSLSSVQK